SRRLSLRRASFAPEASRPLHLFSMQVKTILLFFAFSASAFSIARPGVEYKVFQFPADKIPRIDGDASDWAMVPESYSIGLDQMHDDEKKHAAPDPKDLDVHVKVGWVKGLNRLYFLYEAYDNFWDFADPGLHNDIFEVVVDGDLSGGPLIERFQPSKELSERDAHFSMHGVQA